MANKVEPMQGGPDHDLNGPTFTYRRGEALVRGQEVSNGFLVLAGSHGPVKESPSFEASRYKEKRDRLIEEGVMEIDAGRVVLTRNHLFSSPTAAAAVVGGYPTNKLARWKDEEGNTLRGHRNNPASRPRDSAAHDRPLAPTEREFRRRWYEAHRDRFAADEDRYRESKATQDGFPASAPEALELLADLQRTGDVQSFKDKMQAWSFKPGTLAFKGQSGQMMLNQLVNRSQDPRELAVLLAESLTEPASEDEAIAKIRRVVDFVKVIKIGSHPAPGNVPFVLSYFWGLANHERWPVMWASAAAFLEFSTGENLPSDPAERYQEFLKRVRELAADHPEFEMVAGWWSRECPVFLDGVLCDRAAMDLEEEGVPNAALEANSKALVSIADYWGEQLSEDVEEVLGHSVKVHSPKVSSTGPDLWVDWRIKESSKTGLSMRVWVDDQGAAVALRPGKEQQDWWSEVAPQFAAGKYPASRVLEVAESLLGQENVGFFQLGGEFVYGRWFDREEFHDLDLAHNLVEVTGLLKPMFDELLALAKGTQNEPPVGGDEKLRPLVEEWLAETDYPNQWHKDAVAQRERFAKLLAPERISIDDWQEIRRIWTTKEAGGAGAMVP